MLAITKVKIDSKGRIVLPSSFLKANNIEVGTEIEVLNVYNNDDCIKLRFLKDEE